MNWRGNPKLEPLLVPIETISTHPHNPRRGDLPLLAESLDTFGQTRPIVVQPGAEWIVAGNHTYRAAVEVLAWSHIAVVRPVLEVLEYEQYLLMDNKASDASEYDEAVLAPMLARLQERGDFEHTGWDDEQAADYIAASSRISPDAEREFQSGYGAEDDSGGEGGGKGRLFERSDKSKNQVMLAYSNDAYQDVVRGIGVLRREYGTEGIGNTVARALATQFELVFHGETA